MRYTFSQAVPIVLNDHNAKQQQDPPNAQAMARMNANQE